MLMFDHVRLTDTSYVANNSMSVFCACTLRSCRGKTLALKGRPWCNMTAVS